MDDVISITSDNGSNLLRAIKIWRLFQSHLLDDFLHIDLPFTAQQEAYDVFIDKELKKHKNTIDNDDSEKYCHGIRCAAHTLNLVFDTAIDACPMDKDTIEFGRGLIKKLRTGNIENLIHLRQLPKPQIDVSTRWCSTHTMLESLLKLKSFVEEIAMSNDAFATTEDFWGQISDIRDVLRYITIAMKNFESANLNLSDVYKHVMTLKLELEQYPFVNLAAKIVDIVEDRFAVLLKATPTLACMYLDPRFQCALNEDEKIKAKSYLVKLHERMEIKRLAKLGSDQQTDEHSNESDNAKAAGESENLLEKMLQSKCDRAKSLHQKRIDHLLNEFDFQSERTPTGIDIIDFWATNIASRPELANLAAVVFSIPPAEVMCERDFSTLNFVFNKLRNKLNDESLQCIMFIKSNEDIFQMQ